MQSIKQKLLSTKSQTTILSNMSHEIRTPMNAIIDLQMLLKRIKHQQKNVLTPLKPLKF
jgi:signal transduction histidine kinase